MLAQRGFQLPAQTLGILCRFAVPFCLTRQFFLKTDFGIGRWARGPTTCPEECSHTGQSQHGKDEGQPPQGSRIPPGRQETDPQGIAPPLFQRTGLPQQALKMRAHCFRDDIFFQQYRDGTTSRCPAFVCPIQTDKDFCPAVAFQQWPQDPQGLPLKRHFLFPAGRLVCLMIRIQAPSFRIEDEDMALVRGIRYQGQGIQHPVQSCGIRHGFRSRGLQDDDRPGLPALGSQLHPRLTDAGELFQLPGQQGLPLMAKGGCIVISATSAFSLQGQPAKKYGQKQRHEPDRRKRGLSCTPCRSVTLLHAARHCQISPMDSCIHI